MGSRTALLVCVTSIVLVSCTKPEAAPTQDAAPSAVSSVPSASPSASAAPIETFGPPGGVLPSFDADAAVDTWHGLGAMEALGTASGPDYETNCAKLAKPGATRDVAFTVTLLDGKVSTTEAARTFEQERGARLRCCVADDRGLAGSGPLAGGFEVSVAAGVVSDAKQIRSPYDFELSRFACVRHVLGGVRLPSGGDGRLGVRYVVHPTR
jgi:hypothetical protein